MLKLFLAFFAIWQLAVVLFQFWEPFRTRLVSWQFYLCGLLPTWRMFSPEPADGDYLVFYRTSSETTTAGPVFTEWQLADYDRKAPLLFSLFFNPHGNIIKTLREICEQAVRARSDHNVYYQLLINDLIRRHRLHKPPADPADSASPLLQFQIRWQTPAAVTTIFSSHAHPC